MGNKFDAEEIKRSGHLSFGNQGLDSIPFQSIPKEHYLDITSLVCTLNN